jgi:hypothetical protein
MTDGIVATKITPREFRNHERTHSRAIGDEWFDCIEPSFSKYSIMMDDFLLTNVYPTSRLDKSGNKLTSIYEDNEASPISFRQLQNQQWLLREILSEGYASSDNIILVYKCLACNSMVVKDGIHRISAWIVNGENRELTILQVSSEDWSCAQIDMPNFCRCK